MADTSDINREGFDLPHQAADMTAPDVDAWFVREVLPMEILLTQFLRRGWPNKSDIDDLCQEVYARVYEAAQKKIPKPARPFVFTIARNLLIDQARHAQIVPIEVVADPELLGVAFDAPGPERSVMARDELRQLQSALDHLPPRCRDVVVLSRIEGFSGRQIAQHMGISEATVSEHMAKGMCLLANVLYGEPLARPS
jgi:RNA polymerase sigma factor (sigma-70 family)